MQTRKPKAPKGSVIVKSYKGRLSYVWRYQGKRTEKSANLADTPSNLTKAKYQAAIIQADIETGNFDASLAKYGLGDKPAVDRTSIESLFEDFIVYQRTVKQLDESTLQYKYTTVLKKIQQYFKQKPAEFISKSNAEDFYLWLQSQSNHKGEPIKAETVKSYLFLLQACWAWAGSRHRVERYNPWSDVLKNMSKVDREDVINPFTVEEKNKIIEAFRSDRYYSYLADFVQFKFLTGVRIGEAIGLRWDNVSHDCSIVYITERITDGVRKVSTKTSKSRDFRVSSEVQAMLQRRKESLTSTTNTQLVFPGPNGNPIDKRNFRNRAWIRILEQCNIPYRSSNQTRHTFASHMLDLGIKPALVAEWLGHDLKTFYAKYARNIHKNEVIPNY